MNPPPRKRPCTRCGRAFDPACWYCYRDKRNGKFYWTSRCYDCIKTAARINQQLRIAARMAETLRRNGLYD